jgi:site-specific DNA-methyltransferase (adenine-specific)
MSQPSQTEKLFSLFNETAELLQEDLAYAYLEAIAETGENLFQNQVLQEELTEFAKKRLEKKYNEFSIENYSSEEIRKGFQLAILKGMQENIQPNHQMTPDSIGIFIGYLAQKWMSGKKTITVLDPAIGTGNLLATLLNSFAPEKVEKAIGVDIDDVLIKLAYVGANLQKHPLELFTQDSLEPLFIDPVDLVVSDLPVGYYPNDLRANEYKLKADEGMSYSHHLFIEQSINHLKPGGNAIFLVPNGLFESPEASKLQEYLKNHTYIQAFLKLSPTLFKNKDAGKSILIVQKKKPEIRGPKQVLLAELPKFSNQQALSEILVKIDRWYEEQK